VDSYYILMISFFQHIKFVFGLIYYLKYSKIRRLKGKIDILFGDKILICVDIVRIEACTLCSFSNFLL